MTGAFNPAPALEKFVRTNAAGPLRSLSRLQVRLLPTSGKAVPLPAALNEALELLADACPALDTLTVQGVLLMSPALLRRLGQACPALASLTLVVAGDKELPKLQVGHWHENTRGNL
ncbi:MAG: hypothetical protein WDW38_010404 [Sanguina aurantia]